MVNASAVNHDEKEEMLDRSRCVCLDHRNISPIDDDQRKKTECLPPGVVEKILPPGVSP